MAKPSLDSVKSSATDLRQCFDQYPVYFKDYFSESAKPPRHKHLPMRKFNLKQSTSTKKLDDLQLKGPGFQTRAKPHSSKGECENQTKKENARTKWSEEIC